MATTKNEGTYLVNLLWESSEEGEEYICNMAQIEAFVSNKIDNGDLEGNADLTEITIPDEETSAYVDEFKRWLKEQE